MSHVKPFRRVAPQYYAGVLAHSGTAALTA